MNKTVYIYALTEPNSKVVRYIGSSTNPEKRYLSHYYSNHNGRKFAWVKSLRERGEKPGLLVIAKTDSKNRKAVENSYILFFLDAGADLLNWIYPGCSHWDRMKDSHIKAYGSLKYYRGPRN
jgi:predicted GIY-YIG superfamily endonuclease